jgi:GH15 family glucan-1,4-alpha-glucosidase
MKRVVVDHLVDPSREPRNWDYRYTRMRDASFTVYALLRLGFIEEAAALMSWLEGRFRHTAGRESGPLQIMYRIDGSEHLPEEELSHLEGYMGSAPVRIGNGAATQLQLDIYGELMDALYLANKHGLPVYHEGWREVTRNLEWLIEHGDQLGNFPQAFTHLALISAAYNLDRQHG